MESEGYICNWCFKQYNEEDYTGVCSCCGKKDFSAFKAYEDNKPKIILKIGKKDVLDSIRSGIIWFQSPRVYQENEDNEAIGDRFECAYSSVQDIDKSQYDNIKKELQKAKVYCDGKRLQLSEIKEAKFFETNVDQPKLRILCFYQLFLDDNHNILELDNRLRNFGDHFMFVDYTKLVCKLKELEKYGVLFSQGGAAYYTEQHTGKITPFFKQEDKFSYQHEQRIVLKSNDFLNYGIKQPFKLKIQDDITDFFSEPIPIDKLFSAKKLENII
ncbi:MAG TPA: hypothetical protein PKI60_02400 [Oscillospiraceae bacterium]|nr:hypothetical protein [Oscillospiraceae bacterium]